MDENLHSIDDLFRKAINEYDDTPSSKVLEHLENNLGKRQVVSITRKYKRWKWVAAALLIFSVGMAMYTINLRIKYKEATGKSKVKAPSVKNHIITLDKSSTINRDSQASATQQISDNHLLPHKKSISNLHEKKNTTPVVLNSKVVQRDTVVKASQSARSNHVVLSNKKQSSFNDRRVNAQVKNSVVKKDKNNISAHKQIDDLHYNAASTNHANESKSSVLNKNKNSIEKIKNNFDSTTISAFEKQDDEATNLPFLQHINLNDFLAEDTKSLLLNQPAAPLQMAQSSGTINLNLPSFASNKIRISRSKKFAINVFVSVDNVATHLTNDHPSFREDDKNKIKDDENKSSAYTAGVLAQLNLTKKIGIEAGFSLSTITTNINSKTIFARPDNRGDVNYRISCSSGYAYVSTKYGSRPNQGDSITALSSKNTLKYLSIPIGLQYILSSGKFELRPALTISTNIRTKSEVQTVLSSAGSTESTATNTIEGLKPVYFDAGPRLDAVYNLNRFIGIGITPSARFALSSTTKDGPVNTYLNSFGVAAAIKIRL